MDIPSLDSSGMSDSVKESVSEVIYAYNTNLVELITYSRELENFSTKLLEYYNAVKSILESSK